LDIDQGKISRIHDFFMDFENISERLEDLRKNFPSGVIIPILESDLQNQAFSKIIEGLNQCRYLEKILIALSAKDPSNYEKTLK
jgi:hypothetical protein